MKTIYLKQAMVLSLGIFLTAAAQAGSILDIDEEGNKIDWVPTGQGHGKPDSNGPRRSEPEMAGHETRNAGFAGFGTATGYGINYHGGPVMAGTTNVYFIWYGNWSGNSATAILPNLISKIGGSPYYNINTTYDTSTTTISNSVVYKKSINDNYTQGANLSDTSVETIVNNAIGTGKLPKDAHGVYFVLTSKDVRENTGFCTRYCGWHSYRTIGSTNIKYAFVGDASQQCPSSCSVQPNHSPNDNPGADAMASVIVHELTETVTDPNLNAWYDRSGQENADKCAWTFGSRYTAPNGSLANVKLGTYDFLLQQNWVNAKNGAQNGYCALSH